MLPRRPFKTLLRRVSRDEDGAVTIDWVVLAAITVGFAGIVMNILQDPVTNGGQVIANMIAATN